jgi:uncharacterized Zn-finger protein
VETESSNFLTFSSKLLSCDRCDKSFSTKKYLRKHKLCHTRPYKCTLCNKSFATSYVLQIHIRVHTGENHTVVRYVPGHLREPLIWRGTWGHMLVRNILEKNHTVARNAPCHLRDPIIWRGTWVHMLVRNLKNVLHVLSHLQSWASCGRKKHASGQSDVHNVLSDSQWNINWADAFKCQKLPYTTDNNKHFCCNSFKIDCFYVNRCKIVNFVS